MKKTIFAIFSAILAFCAAGQEKATLAVSKITATPAITSAAKSAGTTATLGRLMDSLESNLTSAFQATRKFDVLSRSDLDAVLKEQDFSASGNVNQGASGAPKTGMMKGAKYVVAVQVDDFQDYTERDVFSGIQKVVENRKIRFGAVAKIIDSETGSVVETANFVVDNGGISDKDSTTGVSGGRPLDALVSVLARDMCSQIANRVADVVFPAKVVAKTGTTVTFNRGDGTGVSVGDEYNVLALGEEMVDPDTGDKLGFEEIVVGKLKVVEVAPKFSKGKLSEDNGVEKGQILRVVKKAAKKPAPASNDEI